MYYRYEARSYGVARIPEALFGGVAPLCCFLCPLLIPLDVGNGLERLGERVAADEGEDDGHDARGEKHVQEMWIVQV